MRPRRCAWSKARPLSSSRCQDRVCLWWWWSGEQYPSMEFTPRAKIAFGHAGTEAQALRHPSVGSQHLLFGLLLLGSGVHFSVLRQLGFTAEALRQKIATRGPTV